MERVWDRFLTDQDRAHLAAESRAGSDSRGGYGTRPALLLIDLYRWVLGDRPQPLLEAIRTWPGSCGLTGWRALPHIQRLLEACREAGIPVIHVKPAEDLPRRRKGSPRHPSQEASASPEYRERFRDRYDIVDEVAPIEGEAVIRKAAPSAFWGTPLAGHLNYLDVDTVIICGESTSGCVRAAVVDARSYRYNVIVPEECVFDRHEAAHAISLFDLDQKYADVVGVDEVLAYVAGIRGARVTGV